jgi:ketosteroid isomerase-like protein
MKIRLIPILALAAAGLLATPLSAATPALAPATDAASDAANQAVVQTLYRAFADNDGATIGGLLAADLVWIEAESGPYADRNPYNGPGAVFEGIFARIGADYAGFVVTPVTYISSGDRVVALGRYTGTNRATGEALDAQFAHVFTVVGGKITGFQQYTDTAQWVDVVTPD